MLPLLWGDDGHGGEIGRAQWLQALACGVEPHVDMNPVLLKPQSNTGAQIIVHGKVTGSAMAREYQSMRPRLLDAVLESFNRLQSQADIVLVEGAGSPAEINLRQGDIANMGFARAANVPVVLVGDIDRGGVIASLVGSHTVLEDGDRKQIKGFVVNKFRGDVSLFDEGRKQITGFTQWRDFGVLPWLEAVGHLPEEDSVWFANTVQSDTGSVKIAVPVFGRIANFDDLDPLAGEDDVNLVFVHIGQEIPADAQLVILAGSKSTISDMAQMKACGWADQIKQHARQGGQIIGICGGYQMLGNVIRDPQNIEGNIDRIDGLGLLEVETVLDEAKTVRVSQAVSCEPGIGQKMALSGYEIHLGKTTGSDCARPMIEVDGVPQGACSRDGRMRGCYLHGLFVNDQYRANLISSLGGSPNNDNHLAKIDSALDNLAQEMEEHLEVDAMFELARAKAKVR